MVDTNPDLRPVLVQYPPEARPLGPIDSLGSAGGFSGAQFWRYQSARGLLVLRRWPREHPSIPRLQFIQAVLWHVHQEGFQIVPLPLETIRHGGYVDYAGNLWELSPWMPGQADYHQWPSLQRLRSAMQALAEFHEAAASFPLAETTALPSPGIRERSDHLARLLSGELAQFETILRNPVWPDLAERGKQLLRMFPSAAPRVVEILGQACSLETTLMPCIRDIWHDHVLFKGDRVSALIDFGALRPENVAADIARLLGSLVADDPEGRSTGLAAYEAIRPLSADERHLIRAFDASSMLLSSLNWLQWVFLDGRHFTNREAILTRVDATLARLTNFVRSGGAV